jgi:ribosome-associated toxin RatA of RatAB toxin-antitoxin module
MPTVELTLDIAASADRVWAAVVDIESYPMSMKNVRSVRIGDVVSCNERTSAWSIILKGSILEWEEREHLDHDARTMKFSQVSGDLDEFDGSWVVEEQESMLTTVRFNVSFEIGIPLLAEMLNPVAVRSLRENSIDMLHGVERQAVVA